MRTAILMMFVLALAGCMREDLRGPLMLSVFDLAVSDAGEVAFVLRAENQGDVALANVLIYGRTDERSHGPVDGRVDGMPYARFPYSELAFDPDARLEAHSSWEQPLTAIYYGSPPEGTEEDPFVLDWEVVYDDVDVGRWKWAYWTCHRADGAPSTAKGCYEWFEYHRDRDPDFEP